MGFRPLRAAGLLDRGARPGVPTSEDGLLTVPDATGEEFEEAARERTARGWDHQAVSQLQGPDVPSELTARLAEIPSCLDQLAAAGSWLPGACRSSWCW